MSEWLDKSPVWCRVVLESWKGSCVVFIRCRCNTAMSWGLSLPIDCLLLAKFENAALLRHFCLAENTGHFLSLLQKLNAEVPLQLNGLLLLRFSQVDLLLVLHHLLDDGLLLQVQLALFTLFLLVTFSLLDVLFYVIQFPLLRICPILTVSSPINLRLSTLNSIQNTL